ncbi:hypothetical protein ACWNXI_01440 [Caldibacillus thermoamylovorans]
MGPASYFASMAFHCSFGDLKPPALTLTINGETVDHRLGTYTWSTSRRGIVADAAAPPLLVKELKPHPAASGAKLRIEFDTAHQHSKPAYGMMMMLTGSRCNMERSHCQNNKARTSTSFTLLGKRGRRFMRA